MDGVGGDEADVAVDAGAGVPAGGGLLGVVDADGDDVFAGVEVGGEVVVEADVAVGAVAEEFAVAVDVGVGHDAVEGDEGALGGVEFWQGEGRGDTSRCRWGRSRRLRGLGRLLRRGRRCSSHGGG